MGLPQIDAYPLWHGYIYHVHRVSAPSERVEHITHLLIKRGYRPNDEVLTFECNLVDIRSVEIPFHIDITIEKTKGEGTLPNVRLGVSPMMNGSTWFDGCRREVQR